MDYKYFLLPLLLIIGILFLLVFAPIIDHLFYIDHKLEEMNCACSEHWMRSYIKYYLYVIIPIFCIGLLINAYLYISDYSIIDLNNNDVFMFYKSFLHSLRGLSNINTIFLVLICINQNSLSLPLLTLN